MEHPDKPVKVQITFRRGAAAGVSLPGFIEPGVEGSPFQINDLFAAVFRKIQRGIFGGSYPFDLKLGLRFWGKTLWDHDLTQRQDGTDEREQQQSAGKCPAADGMRMSTLRFCVRI